MFLSTNDILHILQYVAALLLEFSSSFYSPVWPGDRNPCLDTSALDELTSS